MAERLTKVGVLSSGEIEKIIEAGKGVIKILTCAPEVVKEKHIKMY